MSSTFKTTNWSQIVNARHDGAALGELFARYWPPVYAYIRRTGRSVEDAADLTQSFFTSIVANPRLLEQADPERGRFRSFLLTATKRFLIDDHRRRQARGNGAVVSIDQSVLPMIEPLDADDPAAAFERQWATTVISEALQRTERRCVEMGMHKQWLAFEQRILRPVRQGAAPPPYTELMAQIGASTQQEVYSMVQTMKRVLHRELLNTVRETLDDPSEAEHELAELKKTLAMRQ